MNRMTKAQQKYADYRQTDYWKAVVLAVKKRADYRCQVCNSQHDLEAHHRTYEHRGHELDFLGDLVCLCRRCHGIFHGVVAPAVPPVPIQQPQPAYIPVVPVHADGKKLSKRERRLQRALVQKHVEENFTNVKPHTQEEVDAQMPDGPLILLTRVLVNRCRANGAFTSATVDAFGVREDLTHGWVNRLIGKTMTREQYRTALEGKYIYAKNCFEKQKQTVLPESFSL